MNLSTTILSSEIKQVIAIAQKIAKEYTQPQFSAGHLLKALLHNEIGLSATLASWSKDIHYLREWADLRIEQVPKAGKLDADPIGDASVQRVMEVADMQRLKLGHDLLSVEAVFAAICKSDVGFTAEQLKSFPITETEVLTGFVTENGIQSAIKGEQNGVKENANGVVNKTAGALLKFCIDKSEMAVEGKLDPIVGRDKETRQMIEILGRRSKPNPIIVGPPGVGKTALVDGFANLLAADKVPDRIKNAKLFELDSGALIAGASYKGEVEDRLKKIVNEIKSHENAILFIDEIHMLMDPAAGFGGAANLLKPELARGEITVMGATTIKEYREFIENDAAFSRRFDKVIVEEPTSDVATRMVDHIASKYVEHHDIELGPNTVLEAVSLAKRYVSEKRLPDSAIDLIDNTMSAIKMSQESSEDKLNDFSDQLNTLTADQPIEDYQWLLEQMLNTLSPVLAGKINYGDAEILVSSEDYKMYISDIISQLKRQVSEPQNHVSPEDIAAVVASKTNIPIGKLQTDEKDKLLNIEEHLRKRVVGQDQAIKAISKAILESRAGLKKAGKPVGSFFFTGPTGTGKTELAKTLAEFLFDDESALIRFDMSEFKESVSAALLYGASPGYVGYKEGGLLVNKIREKPYSIVLFDEIEKAHESVFDVFLQILDEGRLTDKQGRKGDFSNAVILFTSNLGQEHIVNHLNEKESLPSSDWIREMYMNDPTIKFRPEFLGRMDAIVPFAPISEHVVKLIFNIQLKDLIRLLKKQRIGFEITEAATQQLAIEGFNPKFGARPIRDVIKRKLRQPLSFKIIGGEINEGDKVVVDCESNEIIFKIEKTTNTKK